MGGNSVSHVSGEDERGGISFVKGIRLSDRVITRMKHSSKLQSPHHSSESQTPPVVATPPLPQGVLPTAPLVENAPVKLLPPPPVKFHSLPPTSVEPIAPFSLEEPKTPDSSLAPLPSTPPPWVDPPVVLEVLPPPPAAEQILQPPVEPFIPPVAQTTPQIPEPVAEPVFIQSPVASSPASVALPETLGHPCEPVKPAPAVTIEPLESAPPPPPSATLPPCFESPLMEPVLPAEAVIPPPQAEATLVVSSAVAEEAPPAVELTPPPLPEHVAALPPAPEPCLGETSPPCHCEDQLVAPTEPPLELVTPSPPDLAPPPDDVEDEEVPVVATVPPPAAALAVPPVIVEEELRQKIKAELQRGLEDEIKQKRDELQRQLEVMRALAQAEAQAAAQAQVDEQVKNTLEAEKEAHTEKLTESIAKARTKTEDERLMAQLYRMELKAHHLEEKEKELKTRDVLYREHVTKLEAKCSEFYKVTAESFQKGKEETHKRFTHFDIQPVCGDLQGQILKCYKENAGKTLSCSSIASAYMQCVDNAKKNKLSTGG